MENDIYEVDRDSYVGFIGELNKGLMDVEQKYENNSTIIKIKSKKTGTLLCARIITDEEEHYYVYEMPLEEEKVPAKPVMKINLDTKEEVQAFFNALAKIQKGEQNDRDISEHQP